VKENGILLQGNAGKGKEDKGKAFFVKRVRWTCLLGKGILFITGTERGNPLMAKGRKQLTMMNEQWTIRPLKTFCTE